MFGAKWKCLDRKASELDSSFTSHLHTHQLGEDCGILLRSASH